MKVYYPERIRERRLKLKLTQAEVAQRAGTTREHYVEIEKGRAIPRATTLTRIAAALAINISYFFVDETEKEKLL